SNGFPEGNRIARDLIPVAPPVERALLVGAPRKGTPASRDVDEHLDELARLVDTAGGAVAGRVIQHVSAPTPDLYVGRGKAQEIGRTVVELGASLAIFDEELSPTQGKHLEEALAVRVMDRTELILDIFALRARSREAKMQVELAQLEYLLPRLTRMWAHLSRIRGGIGLRGPGETQLETDRRMIRTKIGALKGKLAEVAEHRARLRVRTRERDVLRVALVGYTNAGKSSLLRALTGADAHVEDRLFATLDTASRETRIGGRAVRFTDTVGFIRKLPHDLVASFRATLEEAADADVIVHVVDASHPAWEQQAEVVNEVLHDLAGTSDGDAPPAPRVLMALNKVDLLSDAEREAVLSDVTRRGWEGVATSAVTRAGADSLRRLLVPPRGRDLTRT
ncbi:MAG TPA: GTPase HflX, partial [Dongiaceae bacterium]|nr:GTPase HflX [Dongiaceae bacterium]